jgi:hypothetical protein
MSRIGSSAWISAAETLSNRQLMSEREELEKMKNNLCIEKSPKEGKK